MTLPEFSNACRILYNIDFSELIAAGVIAEDEYAEDEWRSFLVNPVSWFIRASDDQQEKLFGIIESRQPKKERA